MARSIDLERPHPAASERLTPGERRTRILNEAEQRGFVTETIALLGMVRGVNGFTDMSRVISPPSRAMIDGERMHGAKTEEHARARAWIRVRERLGVFDSAMKLSGEYARPSDWVRLFVILQKAANPGDRVPSVFTAESPADRGAFRQWAERYSLNGDGLVHIAAGIRKMHEEISGSAFSPDDSIPKIGAFTADQLNNMVRAGFGPEDTYIHMGHGEGYILMHSLPGRFGVAAVVERRRAIQAEFDRQLQDPPQGQRGEPNEAIRQQKYQEIARRYDQEHFGAVEPDRNSVAREGGILGGIFAAVTQAGDAQVGFGYHGITEPDLLKVLPAQYLKEKRGPSYVRRHDGKTVVTVERWLINEKGPSFIHTDELVEQGGSRALEQGATRRIADAIVYDKVDARHRSVNVWDDSLSRPFYWNDVHWVYKRLTEDRLPFLARVAGVDTAPIEKFASEDAEKEWMYERILSSGVTTAKQLDNQRNHFTLRLEDVYPDDPERTIVQEAAVAYPDVVRLGHGSFGVQYEWSADGSAVERGIIAVENNERFSDNSFALRDALPSDVPQLGTREHVVEVIFRYTHGRPPFSVEVTDFPVNRLRELLERIEPQEKMVQRKWYDFENSELGKLRVPLAITVQDAFPTYGQLIELMSPHERRVLYTTDRDGREYYAHATIFHVEGDRYVIGYVQDLGAAVRESRAAQEKHAERQAAERARTEMGSAALDAQLAEVRTRTAQLEEYNREFANDNLVAFVLGREPYTETDQGQVRWSLDKNDFKGAERTLGHRIYDRVDKQETIDAMRRIVATIAELEKFGFDWARYKINAQPRHDDDYDYDYSPRRDSEGFAPGDIRLHNSDVYHPSRGRVVSTRGMVYTSRQELQDLQRRLDRELELLREKQQGLSAERAQQRAEAEGGQSGPEVILRGQRSPNNRNDENE